MSDSTHRPFNLAIALLTTLGAPAALTAAGPKLVTTLTATNEAGLARPATPISCGLPLPGGLTKDASRLALRAGGRFVPAQFEPMVRDPADGSVRWVRVDTVLDLPEPGPGGEGLKVELLLLDEAPKAAEAIARLDKKWIYITTGRLTAMIGREKFIGVDKAWLSPKGDGVIDPDYQVFNAAPGGPTASDKEVTYAAGAGPGLKVELERNGPVACTIRAAGALLGRGRPGPLDYIVRLTAYRGLAALRVQFIWIKARGDRRDVAELSRVGFELPTCLRPADGGYSAAFGGTVGVHTGKLSADNGKAWIAHAEPNRYIVGGSLLGNGSGRPADAVSTGWGAIDNGTVGLAAGRRWFWQMPPADVSAACYRGTGGPVLSLGLYSELTAESFRCYTGSARSHEIYLVLYDPKQRRSLPARMRDLTQPARLIATPKYYGRYAFPAAPLAGADATLFAEADAESAAAVDRQLDVMVDWFNFNRNNFAGASSFGYRYFGDFPAARGPGGEGVLWEGNPYDFPYTCFLQWLRTGEAKFFRAFQETAVQLVDAHAIHADPDAGAIGATRYAPALDQALFAGQPYVSPTLNYLHLRGMMARALIDGDAWAWRTAWEGIARAQRGIASDSQFNEPAGRGNQLLALTLGYRLTGEKKYLRHARRIVGFATHSQQRWDGLYFPKLTRLADTAVACEGLLAYYRVSGDRDALASVRRHLAAMLSKGLLNEKELLAQRGAFAYPFAFCASADDKPEWRAIARQLVTSSQPKSSLHELALACRTMPQAAWFLSKAARKDPSLHPEAIELGEDAGE